MTESKIYKKAQKEHKKAIAEYYAKRDSANAKMEALKREVDEAHRRVYLAESALVILERGEMPMKIICRSCKRPAVVAVRNHDVLPDLCELCRQAPHKE